MKKIFLVIISIFLFIPVIAKAGVNDSTITWELDRSIFVHRVINGEYHLTNMPFLTVNGNVAYCIEPGPELEKDGTMSSTSNIKDTTVNKDVTRASLIGYYGYKKFGHNDPMYYVAAQKLIWLEMGASSVKFTYDREGNNEIDISKYENEILSMVNRHDVVPEFDVKDNYVVGEDVVLKDKNNILNDYNLHSSSSIIRKDSENIYIKIQDKKEMNNFNLVRKSDNTKTIYYYKPGLQTVATFGFPYKVSKEYKLNYTYGSIKLNKYDIDNKLLLKGAEYTLYDDLDNIIDVKSTNEKGDLIFNNLTFGKYKIKETKAPLGYNLDNTMYDVVIDSNNIENSIECYDKIIKGVLNITKLYNNKEKGNFELEKDILFGIYDLNNNLIDSKRTDIYGNVSFELNYGKYIVKQLSTPEGIDKVDNFFIEITKQDEEINYTLVNNKIEEDIKELPQTGKSNYNIVFSSIFMFILSLLFYYEKKIA